LSTKSQRIATRAHRRRTMARGFVRVEVLAPKRDAALIRTLAETLRSRPEKAAPLRSALARLLDRPGSKTAFDLFGSELPDDVFAEVFDQPRQGHWRAIDL
jgi:hypothetical protein